MQQEKTLANEQKDLIRENWKKKRERKTKKATSTIEQNEVEWDNIFDEIQQFGMEIQELLELTEQCDFNNVIHSAKITRCGEAHKRLAQQYFAKAKGGTEKAVKAKNSSGDDGGKYLAAVIGEQLGASVEIGTLQMAEKWDTLLATLLTWMPS